jgi:hypothetical protein
MGAALGTFVFGLLVVCGLAFYFLPTLVAIGRKHRSKAPILMLNLLLGWTLLFWAIALVWAFMDAGATQKKPAADSKRDDYSKELRASIVAAESRIDGVVADRVVTAQGLEEWLRARGWQRDYARFGNLDWHSPRYGVAVVKLDAEQGAS